MAAIVHYVRYVLHYQGDRLQCADIDEVTQIEIPAGINFECLGVLSNFAQLGSTDSGIGLARRAADQDVNRVLNRAKLELVDQFIRLDLGDVADPRVMVDDIVIGPSIEVDRMRPSGKFINFDG